jgi:exodeoxyribonuclease VII small subunit
MSSVKEPPKTFEAGLYDLEGIVEKMETGELSLEDALGAFEQGVGLVRHLGEQLAEVEKRLEVLSRDQDGVFQLQALPTDPEDQEENQEENEDS